MKVKEPGLEALILVVDDEEFVLKALKRLLERAWFRVETCSSGREALRVLEAAVVDVIIADQMMPGMSGMELLVEARRLYPEVVRILLTGQADLEAAVRGINEGKLFRFLTKPWDEKELVRTAGKAVELSRLNRRWRDLLREAKGSLEGLQLLERRHPGISRVARDATGAVVIEEFAPLGSEPGSPFRGP